MVMSVSYEHPLAYLLGLEGVALLRAFAGDFDRDFAQARIAEVRRLLDDARLCGAGVSVNRVETTDGYNIWAHTYDTPGNGAFPYEEPYVRQIIDTLPACSILDAACGTGRHTEYLAAQGHSVIGVDGSPGMLARARERAPSAEFRLGQLTALPLGDDSVDAIVCALALTHVPALEPVFAEFVRVLRPGGPLVISDMHEASVLRGSIPQAVGPDGHPARIASYRHLTGDYLRAAIPLGLQVRGCEEPRLVGSMPEPLPPDAPLDPGPWQGWPWTLRDLIPQATWAAVAHRPVTVIWHFQLDHPAGR